MKMLDYDEEGTIFLQKQKIIGYTTGLMPKVISNKQLELSSDILANIKNNEVFIESKKELKDVVRDTKKFYKKYFKLHNIKVVNPKKELVFFEEDENESIKEKWNLVLVNKDIFKLPIDLVMGHSLVGGINRIVPLVPKRDMSVIENIAFSDIELGSSISDLTAATYAHEIAHSQLESKKGYTNDYHNSEVISIFVEKLAALELNDEKFIKAIEKKRLKDTAQNIKLLNAYNNGKKGLSKEAATKLSMYIESALKAENLFDIYQTSDKEGKQMIISDIQNIFDGKMNLENLLEKNNITEESVEDIEMIKRHL